MNRASAPLGIIELWSVCARQRAINLDLFEQLGALVIADGTAPGDDQQLVANASHRHAWHADLWAQRAPAIPPLQLDAGFDRAVDSYRGSLAPVTNAAEYSATAELLRSELADLLGRIDPLLDPSTTRIINLARADL